MQRNVFPIAAIGLCLAGGALFVPPMAAQIARGIARARGF